MKYRVKVCYVSFDFDDGKQAIEFADCAKRHLIEDKEVEIYIISDQEKEKAHENV